MSPTGVLVATWILAALVGGLYVWFMVWRVRVDRRKKAAAVDDATRMSLAIEKAAQLAGERRDERPRIDAPQSPPVGPSVSARTPGPVVTPAARTVAGALAGISLPYDLVPLTTLADRPGVGDRVAFWTNTAPAEAVGRAMTDELERLGYTVSSIDEQSLTAHRDDQRVHAVIHPDGRAAIIGDKQAFESVPERSVVVEVWLLE